MARNTLLLFICVLLFKISRCAGQNCYQENSCLCRFNELQKVDLWPLVKSTHGLYSTTNAIGKYFFRACENYYGPPKNCGFNYPNGTKVQCVPPFSVSYLCCINGFIFNFIVAVM